MRSLNTNIYPSGGHYFMESDGTEIRADSWPGVWERLKLYRERAGRPVGNPQEEVINQVCNRYPGICLENQSSSSRAFPTQELKAKVLTWMHVLRGQMRAGSMVSFIGIPTARVRATICAQCPHNKQLPADCGSCEAAQRELRAQILGGRFRDGRLFACELLGEDTVCSVHLDSQSVLNPALPGFCWRKRTI